MFNALARLAEDASAFSAPGESAAGESALEMEARADEILHSPAPKRPAKSEPGSDGEDLASGDVEFARLQLIEKFKPVAVRDARAATSCGSARHHACGAAPIAGAQDEDSSPGKRSGEREARGA